MNNMMMKTGPAYIADAREGNIIKFRDPIDHTTIITGSVFTLRTDHNGRSTTRVFKIFGINRLFVLSANYHITIL